MKGTDRIETYAAFWPFYLRQHGKPATRAWHIGGTAAALVLIAGAISTFDGRLLLAAIVAGYIPAWVSHAFVERNAPATFSYPLWSLFSDFRMAALWLAGDLGPELERAGVRTGFSSRS